jgi:hypothetical protein
MGDGVTPESQLTNCDPGSYKTNVACLTSNADRLIDTTCRPCYSQCRPGDPSTLYAGEYISKLCNGTGYNGSVGCTTCTDQCNMDDQYMDTSIVCTGKTYTDTRPAQACKPCTTQCPQNAYVPNRCLHVNKPTNNSALCKACSGCLDGQYLSSRCNGSTFVDTGVCVSSRYGRNGLAALQVCTYGTVVLNECLTGMDAVDESVCTACVSNCKPANYSAGEDGQYILDLCKKSPWDNTCAKCSSQCQSHVGKPPGQYIIGFCTGLTQFDRKCADCRISCQPGEYIAGPSCTGETPVDTTYCTPCTPRPSDSHVTPNPCTGATRMDQKWEICSNLCPAGNYVSNECTETSYTDCQACKTSCPTGYYMGRGTTR